MSCGRINNQHLMPPLAATQNVASVDEDFEMSAIQTWSEVSLKTTYFRLSLFVI
jgi:hypothetical protein